MWQALDHVAPLVGDGGKLFLSIYDDLGRMTRVWTRVKRTYNRLPRGLRFLVLAPSFLYFWGPTMAWDLLRGRPFQTWRGYGRERGMSPWRDLVDWVGGYPFEVAKPEAIFDFYRDRGFVLTKLFTCGGSSGCNQFVFEMLRSRAGASTPPDDRAPGASALR
jgi:2-polyprenyl-6-hydroxyphenyl methylase/3-demethylubiquinone-9 3-methyltransferase